METAKSNTKSGMKGVFLPQAHKKSKKSCRHRFTLWRPWAIYLRTLILAISPSSLRRGSLSSIPLEQFQPLSPLSYCTYSPLRLWYAGPKVRLSNVLGSVKILHWC